MYPPLSTKLWVMMRSKEEISRLATHKGEACVVWVRYNGLAKQKKHCFTWSKNGLAICCGVLAGASHILCDVGSTDGGFVQIGSILCRLIWMYVRNHPHGSAMRLVFIYILIGYDFLLRAHLQKRTARYVYLTLPS